MQFCGERLRALLRVDRAPTPAEVHDHRELA